MKLVAASIFRKLVSLPIGVKLGAAVASIAALGVYQNCAQTTFQASAAPLGISASQGNVVNLANCTFNGSQIKSGQSVPAFQNSTVAYGQTCVSESRFCTNGNLSGSYSYASCAVDAPAACLFNGQTIQSGQSVTAYQNSTVPYGNTCVSQPRTCTDGALSGNYNFASCTVGAPASCIFNGQTIASGQSVNAFQNSTVPYGQTCVSQPSLCTNGSLSSAYTNPSCTVGAPATCTFNGQVVAHGANVTAYQNSTVPYGQSCVSQTETCTNGTLSGNYPYASCVTAAPASCLFGGATIPSGQSVTAYAESSVPYGQVCQSQQNLCTNGTLSSPNPYTSCTVGAPASCTFNGATVAHGSQVTACSSSSVPYGQSCNCQSETCQNGSLVASNGASTASFTYAACVPQAPAACIYNGATVSSGTQVQGFTSANVPYGQTCTQLSAKCTNGSFDQTLQPTCTVGQPASCTFNGQTIASGNSVKTYLASSVPFGQTCQEKDSLCTNGTMSAAYANTSCTIQTLCGSLASGPSPVTSVYNGVASNLTYIPSDSSVINGSMLVSAFLPGQPSVVSEPGFYVMNQLNVPMQDFSQGFLLSGSTYLKDLNGNILTQYFSLQSVGTIQLALNGTTGGVTTPGYYQFALLSDDGSVFNLTDSDGKQISIGDDGYHPNRFACATAAAHLTATPMSYTLNYFQGPPTRLGLILFWRPVDPKATSWTNDSNWSPPHAKYCPGYAAGDNAFFTGNPPVGTPAIPLSTGTTDYHSYADLLSEGWVPVPNANLFLPAGVTNTCNQ